MARTSQRRWKGCAMCKWYKDDRFGQADRKPWKELRKTGKKRRVGRHDIPKDQLT